MSFPVMDHPPAREIFPPCLLHLGTEVKSHFQNECEHSQRWTLNCVLFILILELLRYVLLRYQISTGFSRRKWPPPPHAPPQSWNTQNVPISLFPLCQASCCVLPERGRALWRPFLLMAIFLESGKPGHAYTCHKRMVHSELRCTQDF